MKYREGLKAIALLLIALVMAYWANLTSENEALSRWERTDLPPAQIVRFALESFGMSPLKNPRDAQKIIRTLPTLLDEAGSLWTSADSNWIAYFGNPELWVEPEIFCARGTTETPSLVPLQNNPWQSLGFGWKALKNVLERLKNRPQRGSPSAQKLPLGPPFILPFSPPDPRAITY